MQTHPMEYIIKMQPKGVLTIPKKIREVLGIKEGMYLRITADHGRITIEPVRLLPYHSPMHK